MKAVEQYFPVVLFNFTVQLLSVRIRSEVGVSAASNDSSPCITTSRQFCFSKNSFQNKIWVFEQGFELGS